MQITITGATGLIGSKLVAALQARGDDVVVLSRDADRAARALGVDARPWDPMAGPAPTEALAGAEAVVHLAGEPVAQRWTTASKQRIRASREIGTANLVAGIAAAEPRPATLVSASAVGYYGPRGDERLDESEPAGADFLAGVCVAWERAALAAQSHGLRVSVMRTGVVLDPDGGALAKMLPPFRAGIGGPVAGGRQYLSWIDADDLVGLYLAAIDEPAWAGPVNATAPEPVTNAAFSKALGAALHRPAIAPVPGIAIRLLYGDMAEIITEGQRVIPARAQAAGFEFRQPEVGPALEEALG